MLLLEPENGCIVVCALAGPFVGSSILAFFFFFLSTVEVYIFQPLQASVSVQLPTSQRCNTAQLKEMPAYETDI